MEDGEPGSLRCDDENPLKHFEEAAQVFSQNPQMHYAYSAYRWSHRAWGSFSQDLVWNDALANIYAVADQQEADDLQKQGMSKQSMDGQLDRLSKAIGLCLKTAEHLGSSERRIEFVSRWDRYNQYIKVMRLHGMVAYLDLQERRFTYMRNHHNGSAAAK